MDARPVWLLLTFETALAGGLTLLVPRITRRGLLFGVYVGEDNWRSDGARRITARWYRAMTGAVVASVVLGGVISLLAPATPMAGLAPIAIVLTAMAANYLRAHTDARALAVTGAPASAVFVSDPPGQLNRPLAATAMAILLGCVAIGDAWLHYADMPGRVPTHFGPSGAPDAWAAKSFITVMLLPLMTLAVSLLLGITACLTALAKRAVRQADRGVSFDAQMRFRRAMSTFVSGITVLTALLLSGLSYGAVRVATGQATALPAWAMGAGIVLLVYAIGGSFVLMLRIGQGGAKLERAAESQPLTNGLADNSHWVLGMFYVNRDDPSFMVEKRFGFGYTLNFGNPKAVAALVIPLVIVLALSWAGVLTK
jgi:uncharacterized membrane protein